MSSQRDTIWLTLTIFSPLLIFPSPTNALPASNLINLACNNIPDYKDWNITQCIETLESDPQISSVTNLPTLATTIIDVGVTNATNTRAFIQQKVNGELEQAFKSALVGCVVWYNDTIENFNNALAIIKEDSGYDSATFVLQMAVHDINYCDNLVASTNVQDSSISIGNKFVMLFSAAAGQVTTILNDQNEPAPSPPISPL